MSIVKTICFILVVIAYGWSFNTSSESGNPFNHYASPSGGVNMYSGTAAYTHPLVSLPGRGGMGIDVALHYSSNVYLNVRSRNDKSPTSWLGLGWAMSYGAIMCNHKGTRTHQDDQFFYISPQGVPSRITDIRGINFKYYEYSGGWTALPDFSTLTPVRSGKLRSININQRRNDYYAFLFEGTIKIATTGDYTFYTSSDDGSKLYIDGKLVVNNDYLHPVEEKSGTVKGLTAGFHPLRVEFFNEAGDVGLQVKYAGPGISKQSIPWQVLYPQGVDDERWTYYIENDPYSRLEAQTDANGVIKGWIVKTIDGKKLKYGNLDFTDGRAATRNVFAWNMQVGSGWGGNPDLYPYQWDLSEVEDVYGNKVVYKYQQELEPLVRGSWDTRNLTPAKYYTKASYISSVTTPDGGRVEFILENKTDVPPDPHRLKPEYDAFIEMYESKRLKTVKAYRTEEAAEELISFDFSYSSINGTQLGADYRKGLLTEIVEYKGSPTNMLKKTVFEYCTDYNKADPVHASYDKNYNYGALWKIKNGMGGTSEYVYKREELNLVHTSANVDPSWTPRGLYAGTLSDGNAYMVSRGTTDKNAITIYNWDGTKWGASNIVGRFYGVGEQDVDVFPAGDHIVLRAGADDYFQILSWDGKEWITTMGQHKKKYGSQSTTPVIFGNHVAFVEGAYDVLEIISWNGVDWDLSFPQQKINTLGTTMELAPGDNHLGIRYGNPKDYMEILTYNGSTWDRSFPQTKIAMPGEDVDLFPSGDHFLLRHGDDDYIQIISWSGQQWDTTFQRKKLGIPGWDVDVFPGYERFLLRHGDDDILQVLSWNGVQWDTTFQRTNLKGGDADVDPYMGNDYIALRHGWRNNTLQVLGWDGTRWDTTFARTEIGMSTNDFELYPGNDFMVFRHGADDYVEARSWNGKSWETSFPRRKLRDGGGVEIALSGNAFGVEGSADSLWFFYKFQDGFQNPVYSYSVSELKAHNGLGKVISTTFDFNADSKAHYDTRSGTAKMNKVETKQPGNGKSVTYYFTDDPSQASINADYTELDGASYRTDVYNEANAISETKTLSSSKTTYSLYSEALWPPKVTQKRVTKVESTRDGVTSQARYEYYPGNGQVWIVKEKNSDGKWRVTHTHFAYVNPIFGDWGTNPIGLGPTGKNMLTQPCRVSVLEFPNETAASQYTGSGSDQYIRKTNVVTWTTDRGAGAGVPVVDAQYTWVKEAKTGTQSSGYVDFWNYPVGSPGSEWIRTKKFERYTSTGQVFTVATPVPGHNDLKTTAIFGHRGALPIATISLSNFDECGVFTGDYDDNESGYFDKANKWEKAGGVLNDVEKHFGEKTIKVVNNFGPSRNFTVYKNKTYVFSAWVKVTSTTGAAKAYVDYRTSSGTATGQSEPAVTWTKAQGSDWKYLEIVFNPTTKISGDVGYVRVFVGAPDGGTVYVDDIRFAPSKSLVSSTYYHPLWQKPVCSVDANNQPSRFICYDGFGREEFVFKIDRTKSRVAGATYDKLVTEKQYHLMGVQ